MSLLRCLPLMLLCALVRAAEPGPDDVVVPPLQTSIYVASLTLTPGRFERHGDTYTTTYAVAVWPWSFCFGATVRRREAGSVGSVRDSRRWGWRRSRASGR